MTRDGFIGQLEDYLTEFNGETPLPDRVRDALHAELPRTRQVRPRPGLLKGLPMFSNAPAAARWGVVAATLVVAAALGAGFLYGGAAGGIGGPAPTPVPTPSPSPTPIPITLKFAPTAPCDATDTQHSCLAAGTYQLTGAAGVWPATVSVTVPAGWFEWDYETGADAILVDGGPEARDNSGWGVTFTTVGGVAKDPCNASAGTVTMDTPERVAAAMAAWPGFSATAPQPVSVDGRPGVEFVLSSTQKSLACQNGSIWTTASGKGVDTYPMVNSAGRPMPTTFRIVDTGAGLLAMRVTDVSQPTPLEISQGIPDNPTRHAKDQPGLHAILDSVRISDPQPSPSR